MLRHDYLKIVALFFVSGLIVAYFLPIGFLAWHYLYFSLVLLGFFAMSLVKRKKAVFLAIIFFILGIWRFSLYYPLENIRLSLFLDNQPSYVYVQADNLNKVYDASDSWNLQAERIFLGATEIAPENFYLQAYLPREHGIKSGDRLGMECVLRRETDPMYMEYLLSRRIFLKCAYPEKLEVLSRAPGLPDRLKDKAGRAIRQNISYPASSIALALAIGDKSSLSQQTRDDFSRSGLSHILAISGLHIAVWSGILCFFFFRLGMSRQTALLSGVAAVWIYVLFIGSPASALRAAIMASFLALAFASKRYYANLRVLLLAGSLILCLYPLAWRHDLGFQLSFLAIGGIIVFYPLASGLLNRLKASKPVLESYFLKTIIVTICAQILTWPLISYNFKTLSLVSLLANILVIWILPGILLVLALALLSGSLALLSSLFFFLSQLALNYLQAAARILAGFELLLFEPELSMLFYILYYFVIIILVVKTRKSESLMHI